MTRYTPPPRGTAPEPDVCLADLPDHGGRLRQLRGQLDVAEHRLDLGRLAGEADGKKWTTFASMGDAHLSRRNTALASYDGKLHAAYPSVTSDALVHAVYDGTTWGTPTTIKGHDSRNTPALLTCCDTPDTPERLLLVHRGVDTYVPSPPPEPVTPASVATYHDSRPTTPGPDCPERQVVGPVQPSLITACLQAVPAQQVCDERVELLVPGLLLAGPGMVQRSVGGQGLCLRGDEARCLG